MPAISRRILFGMPLAYILAHWVVTDQRGEINGSKGKDTQKINNQFPKLEILFYSSLEWHPYGGTEWTNNMLDCGRDGAINTTQKEHRDERNRYRCHRHRLHGQGTLHRLQRFGFGLWNRSQTAPRNCL